MRVDFFGDPVCPWTWIASRWLALVSKPRHLDVHWRSYSLELRDGEGLSAEIPAALHDTVRAARLLSRRALRVGEAVRVADSRATGVLYATLATQLFNPGRPPTPPRPEMLADALRAAGLASWADAADDPDWDEAIIRSMREAFDAVGDSAGSPTIVFDGRDRKRIGVSGPTLSATPGVAASVRVWDAVVQLAEEQQFVDVHRTRTVPVLSSATP